jgi:hypothetical protein
MGGMNVLNVPELERELHRYAARACSEHARRWVMSVARNYFLSGMPRKDFITNFRAYTPHQTKHPDFISARDIGFKLSMRNGLPSWADAALERGETLMWFDPFQVTRREIWNVLEIIVHWFNFWKKDDPRLRRIDRISFQTATNAAVLWNKNVTENIWDYVTDKPVVVTVYEQGFHWVRLVTALQFEREGQLMKMCIGNGTYYARWRANSACQYYSLRDALNKPHASLEVIENCLQQCKGNSNRKPEAAYQPYIRRFVTEMKWEIKGDELMIDP